MPHLLYKVNDIMPMDVTWQLPVDVAKHLDKAGIPHLLWGAGSMKLLGIDNWDLRVEFIVPDHLLAKGNQTLLEAGFIKCGKNVEVCHQNTHTFAPVENIHFHPPTDKRERQSRKTNRDGVFGVVLHPKSSLLWALPDIPLPPSLNDANYMLSIDSRATRLDPETNLPFFESQRPYAFIILTPRAHFNALIRLRLRDWNQPNQYYLTWSNRIYEFRRTLLKNGFLGTDDVEHIFRTAFYILYESDVDTRAYSRQGDYYPEEQRFAIELIRYKLLQKGELTEPPV